MGRIKKKIWRAKRFAEAVEKKKKLEDEYMEVRRQTYCEKAGDGAVGQA